MSETAVSQPAAGASAAPLEDLMVAMDVVDTIRHRQLIVDRELDAGARRERLVARLREIYTAQGIEVTDAALAAGVEALEAERFAYTPTGGGFGPALARLYVRRDRWLKPLMLVLALVTIVAGAWYWFVELPEARRQAAIPAAIEQVHERIGEVSASPAADERAAALYAQAQAELAQDDYDGAESVLERQRLLLRQLEQMFEVRVVSRPGEQSGIWRIPDLNPDARNYYLIVEAVGPGGIVVPQRIVNEETGRERDVRRWGLRVPEETFNAVAADKQDDGIIQDAVVGRKVAGKLVPDYSVPTTGAAITDW